MSIIGENLRRARQNSGLTQKEVEAHLNLRSLSVRDFESERLKLPVDIAVKFAKLYHVSLDDLIQGKRLVEDLEQKEKLTHLEFFFHKGDVDFLFFDPVIRAQLEEYPDKVLDTPVFEILTIHFSEKQKNDVKTEILKTIGSLLGIDYETTDAEIDFFVRLCARLGLSEKSHMMNKSLNEMYLPKISHFHQRPSIRHFLLWVLFFIARSDGIISNAELEYIQECSDALRIHRSHFLGIKKYFVREIH